MLHEIEALKLENLRLEKEKNEMDIKNKALQIQQENLISHHDTNNLTHNTKYECDYYLLYGFCSKGNGINRYHYIIMDSFKAFIASQFPQWILLNISIESFLIHHSNENYTHQKLLDFTQANVPSIDINKDKFQWIFEPCCEKHFSRKDLNLKELYQHNSTLNLDKHLNLTDISLPRPQTAKDFMQKHYGIDIVDDNEREDHSHIVTMNHRKYKSINQSYEYEINIPDDELNAVRLSNMWQNNIYIHSNIKYLQSLATNRPLLISISGEVFDAWRIRKRSWLHGHGVDLHMQRTLSWPRPGCIVTAYIQGILQRDLTFDRDWVCYVCELSS